MRFAVATTVCVCLRCSRGVHGRAASGRRHRHGRPRGRRRHDRRRDRRAHRAGASDRHRHTRDQEAELARSSAGARGDGIHRGAAPASARRSASSATSSDATTTDACSATSTSSTRATLTIRARVRQPRDRRAGVRPSAHDRAEQHRSPATSPLQRGEPSEPTSGCGLPARPEPATVPVASRRWRSPSPNASATPPTTVWSSCRATTSARATPRTSACSRRSARAPPPAPR